MAPGRATRSSKAAQGPSLTDHFLQSRAAGTEGPIKTLGDEAPPPSASRAKRTLFASSTRVKVELSEVVYETAPVETVQPKPRTSRALFGEAPKKTTTTKTKKEVKVEIKEEVKKDEIKEEAKAPEPVRSIIPTATEAVAPAKPAARGPRSVADLQAALAKKGAARIHEQAVARKLEQVAEREALLKSPTKAIAVGKKPEVGGSPPKRARKEKEGKKKAPLKVLPVPSFVLPQQSVEKSKTAMPLRERSEEREASPQEDSMTRAPAGYGSTLMTEEVKRARGVEMPGHYKELHGLFKDVDQIMSLYDSRNVTLTLTTLLTDMQKRKKPFSRVRFSQLLAVFPSAYRVELVQLGIGTRAPRWEHKIRPNVETDITDFVTGPLLSEQPAPAEPLLTTSPRKNLISPMKGRPITTSTGIRIPASPRKPAAAAGSPTKQLQREVVMDTRKRLEGWRQTCRQQVFRCLLARRVLAAHERFLEEKGVTIPQSSSDFLPLALHPTFVASLNSACPPVEEAAMEEIPVEENASTKGHQGMSEFIRMADDTVRTLPKGVEEALLELRSPEKKAVSARGVPLSPIKFAAAKPKPMSLLEKIKAREAEAKMAEARRNPQLEAKLADLNLLEHKMMRLVFDIYRFNSRTSMETKKLAQQVAASGRTSEDTLLSLISRLPSILPSHFSISRTTIGEFVKTPDNSVEAEKKVMALLREEIDKCNGQAAAHSLRMP